jgi:hypothetical protein
MSSLEYAIKKSGYGGMIPHLVFRVEWNRDVLWDGRGVHHHLHGQIPEVGVVVSGYFMELVEEAETLCTVQCIGPAVQYQFIQLTDFTWVHGKAPSYHSVEASVGRGDKVSPLIFSPGCSHRGDPRIHSVGPG